MNRARAPLFTFVLGLWSMGGLEFRAGAQAEPPASVVPDAARAVSGEAPPAASPVRPRPSVASAPDRRCFEDRAGCVTPANYVPDICRAIEAAAHGNALDPHFFARLLWRESLFDAAAVSPAGAQGIAQFLPETARLRGLADPFNPVEALHASAQYLSELSRDYGNLGLAAAAYNGGEARVARFVAREGGLPDETRAYVQAITGHSAETWRDAPPSKLDLSLAAEGTFQEACVDQAATRSLRAFRSSPPLSPWGVVLASHQDRNGAERQVARLRNRHAAILRGEPVAYTHARIAGMRRSLHNAQIGRNSRAEADALCDRLRAAGGSCMVLRN